MPNAGGDVEIRGLSKSGIVTRVISSTVFECSQLAGLGDNRFQDWQVWVVWKSDGTAAPPQNDFRACTGYISLSGRITIDSAFAATVVSPGDEIYMIHPILAANVNIMTIPSNNIKQSNLPEVCTASPAPVLMKQIVFSGKAGGARLSVSIRTGGAGIATAYFFRNGAFIPTTVPMITVLGIYTTFTQDVYGLIAGDILEVYLQTNALPNTACCQDFTLGYDIIMVSAAEFGTDYIYVNQVTGIAGTAWPAGTAAFPSNNFTDAITIANNKATHKLHIVGPSILDQDLLGWLVIGDSPTYDYVDFNGFDVAGSSFKWINLRGATPGLFYAQNCILGTNAPNSIICSAHVYDSPILGIEVPTGYYVATWKCAFGNTIDITGGQLYIIDGIGDLDINSMTGVAPVLNVLRGDSDVLIEAGCISGLAYITGNNHRLTNNTGGTVVFEYCDYPNGDYPVNALVTTGVETPIVYLPLIPDIFGYIPRITVTKLRLKASDPGVNVINVRLYELVNAVLTLVDQFEINAGNWNTYFNLMDIFNLPEIKGSQIVITAEATAIGPYALTGSYMYKSA